MFDVFTLLARGDGKPPLEGQRLPDSAWHEDDFARHRGRPWLVLIVGVTLVILVAIIALSFGL